MSVLPTKCFAATVLVAVFSISSIANAHLVGRLAATPGGTDYQAYYNDEADLTWLADANVNNGVMNWTDANAWAAGLNVGGVTGWRLPDTIDVGNDGTTYTSIYQGVDYGYNITTHSEMSNMFYNVLGNTARYDTSGTATGCTAPDYCLSSAGPFTNLQSGSYWSATEYAPSTDLAWYFLMHFGDQRYYGKTSSLYAWAVLSGDVSAVPVPAAVWLFGSGLIGLIGFAKRKKR